MFYNYRTRRITKTELYKIKPEIKKAFSEFYKILDENNETSIEINKNKKIIWDETFMHFYILSFFFLLYIITSIIFWIIKKTKKKELKISEFELLEIIENNNEKIEFIEIEENYIFPFSILSKIKIKEKKNFILKVYKIKKEMNEKEFNFLEKKLELKNIKLIKKKFSILNLIFLKNTTKFMLIMLTTLSLLNLLCFLFYFFYFENLSNWFLDIIFILPFVFLIYKILLQLNKTIK